MKDDLKQRVLALGDREWLLLLSHLSHHVTVLMRGCYPYVANGDPSPDNYQKWQWMNELMHQITGQLAARVDPRPWSRPRDETHLEVIFEVAERADSVADLRTACENVIRNLELEGPNRA